MKTIIAFLYFVFLSPGSWMVAGLFTACYYITDGSITLLVAGAVLFIAGAVRLINDKLKKNNL